MVLSAAVTAAVLSGCAADDGSGEGPGAAATTESVDLEERRAERAEARARQAAADCQRGLQKLTGELRDVDSRLSVGLTQDDYNSALGDVRVAYDTAPFKRLDRPCLLKVGVPLESAFQKYLNANEDWADCINNYGCNVDQDVLPGMRKDWAEATRLIRRSQQGLVAIRTPPS